MYPSSIVWADLRFNRQLPSACSLMTGNWVVKEATSHQQLNEIATHILPSLLVFEFDRPDIPTLSGLSNIRRCFTAIPLLMLTQYHSEALAVWALRNRVVNYLVVPMPQNELLASVEEALTTQQQGVMPCTRDLNPIPNELRFRNTVFRRTAAAITYVESHYYEPIQEEEAAGLCAMSVSSFSRIFKKEQGDTFREYVVRYRINKACELLSVPGASVTGVTFATGFNDVSYFSRIFRQIMGQTPSKFQQESKVLAENFQCFT